MALTQEEIDALLSGGGSSGGGEEGGLSEEQRSRLIAYAERLADAAGSVLSQMSGQSFDVSFNNLASTSPEELGKALPGDVATIIVEYNEGLQGQVVMVWGKDDANAVAQTIQQAMGLDVDGELGDQGQDVLAELTNTIFGTAATTLAAQLETSLGTTPPVVVVGAPGSTEVKTVLSGLIPECFAVDLDVSGVEGNCLLLISVDLQESLAPTAAEAQAPPPQAPPRQAPPRQAAPPPPRQPAQPQPSVSPVVFDEFQPGKSSGETRNLDLIMGIDLDVKVELGRTSMKVKDILDLGSGSVIELDKLAGEPVELYVNDHLFAKGEVIVIDENFGIRITDIVNVERRIDALR